MNKHPLDCLIVGGGIAGLQAAIQLGRYAEHDVLVVDAGKGRSTLCRGYHNLLGWPDGVAGLELRARGRMQAERLGVSFADDEIVRAAAEGADADEERVYALTGRSGRVYRAKTILLATGVTDRYPPLPGLEPCLGRTIYVCPDCDGYEVRGRQTAVLGAGDAGARMALQLSSRTDRLVYLNHERTPVTPELAAELERRRIGYAEASIEALETAGDGELAAVLLSDGRRLPAERAFIAFGGNRVHSELAQQLGVPLRHNRHVEADPRSRMTAVPGIWAAGDIGVHAEQAAVAMGEGILSAIWIHKRLTRGAAAE